jgi:hypothetical protein
MARWLVVGVAVLGAVLLAVHRRRAAPPATETPAAPAPRLAARAAAAEAETAPGAPAWIFEGSGPPRRVAGRVIAGGEPVAGATVRMAPNAVWRVEGAWSELVTGRDGRFDLGPQAPRHILLAVSAAGKVPLTRFIDLTEGQPADELTIELDPCEGKMSGVVRDQGGGVIVKARVGSSHGGFAVETDAHGRYEVCAGGEILYTVTADGYGSVETALGPGGRDVLLGPEAIVEGRCLAAEDRRPVAGAVVKLHFERGGGAQWPAPAIATSDDGGRFRMTGVAAGRYAVTAMSADRVSTSTGEVHVTNDPPAAELTVLLEASSRVSGRVLREGQPLAGARVWAFKKDRRWGDSAVTAGDGSFVHRRVPPGRTSFDVVDEKELAPVELDVSAPEHGGLVIELARLGAIRARVLRGGQPVDTAFVTCTSGDSRNHRQAREEGGGRYACGSLEAGTYDVEARVRGDPRAGQVKVTLADREEKDVVLELPAGAGASIAGVVVDQHGEPLAGVRVYFAPTQGWGEPKLVVTDEHGRFLVEPLRSGRYRPRVLLPELPREYTPIEPFAEVELPRDDSRAEGVVLEVHHDALEIRGRVLDASGAPAAALVEVAKIEPGLEPALALLRSGDGLPTGEDGAFSIQPLPRGDYALRARTPDGSVSAAKVYAAGTSDVELRLTATGAIAGKLVGFTRPPAVEARPDERGADRIRARVEGASFHLAGLRPGRYVVTANGSDGQGDARAVEIGPGATVAVTLTNRGTGSISGRVVDFRSRAPVAGLRCRVTRWADEVRDPWGEVLEDAGALTADDGTFRLSAVPAGEVVVQCMPHERPVASAERALSLVAGGHATVELVAYRCEFAGTDKQHSKLGVELDLRRLTAHIAAVEAGSPAERAGLAPGDVITAVGTLGVEELSSVSVASLISDHEPGTRVPVTVRRRGQRLTVEVTTVPR